MENVLLTTSLGSLLGFTQIEGIRGSTKRKAFCGSKFSPVTIHHRRMPILSYFREATFESVSCYNRLSEEIQKHRERNGRRQGSIVNAFKNDSNYEIEEQRWMREDQRWLREEQRWFREKKRWEREEARWTEAKQALEKEVKALKEELEELRGQRGHGGEIADVSLRNLVAGMRNLLQALAVPGSEGLAVLNNPEVLKQIRGTSPLSEGSTTTVVVRKSETVVTPLSSVASPDKISSKRGGRNYQETRSPTPASLNSSNSANSAASIAPPTTATKRTMKSGMEGDDVKDLHDVLSELGFYSGEEDIEFSVFSEGTESAVKTWQSTRGVPEDGKVTKELMAALIAEVEAKLSSKNDGAKSNSELTANAETTKPKEPTPEIKQLAPVDDLREREIDRYERSDAQETGTGSSRRVYLLGENRWEEPDRVQKKQEELRRIKNGQTSRMKVGAEMCFACRGVGTMLCTDCEGTGDLNVEEQFLEWLDEGEAKCPYCEGSGAVDCDVCFSAGIKTEK